MLHRYRLCLKFAGLFDSEYAYDITHDAWEYYRRKTNTDLFQIPLKDEASYLYTVIKKAFYRWYYKERRGPKYIYSPAEWLGTEEDVMKVVNDNMLLDLLRKSFVGRAHKPLVAANVFDALRAAEGDQTEAAKILETSKQHIQFYVKQLRNFNTTEIHR